MRKNTKSKSVEMVLDGNRFDCSTGEGFLDASGHGFGFGGGRGSPKCLGGDPECYGYGDPNGYPALNSFGYPTGEGGCCGQYADGFGFGYGKGSGYGCAFDIGFGSLSGDGFHFESGPSNCSGSGNRNATGGRL